MKSPVATLFAIIATVIILHAFKIVNRKTMPTTILPTDKPDRPAEVVSTNSFKPPHPISQDRLPDGGRKEGSNDLSGVFAKPGIYVIKKTDTSQGHIRVADRKP